MVNGTNAARTGALWGAIAGLVLLLVVAVLLLRTDGSSYKVLAAVVMWALPFPGFGAGIGWLLGSLAGSVARRSHGES